MSIQATFDLDDGKRKTTNVMGNQDVEKIKHKVKGFEEVHWEMLPDDKILNGFSGWMNDVLLFLKLTTIQ